MHERYARPGIYPPEQITEIFKELRSSVRFMFYPSGVFSKIKKAAEVYCFPYRSTIVPDEISDRAAADRVYVMLDGSAESVPNRQSPSILIPDDTLKRYVILPRALRCDIVAASPAGTDVLIVPSLDDIRDQIRQDTGVSNLALIDAMRVYMDNRFRQP